jgi:hypothetical protein
VGVGPVEVGDEMGGAAHAPIGRLAEPPGPGEVARFSGKAGQCVEGEDLDRGVVVVPGIIEDRHETRLGAGPMVRDGHGGQQAFAERRLFSTSGDPVPRGGGFEGRPGPCDLPQGAQDASEMHPGERRQADVAGGLGLVDRQFQGGRTSRVVTGLALRPPEA